MDKLIRSQLGELRWAPVLQRVRAFAGGAAVVDSTRVRLVWEPHRVVGSYAVPREDVLTELLDAGPVAPADSHPPVLTPAVPFGVHTVPGTAWDFGPADGRQVIKGAGFTPQDPDVDDYVILDWRAFDEWREEDQVVHSHPHDPLKRIDCLTSDRHVVVTVDGETLADTRRAVLLLETGLQRRWYVPRDDIRMDLLEPSPTSTSCAYKGDASYWSFRSGERRIEDVAWSYEHPLHDAVPVTGMLCFYDDRVQIDVQA
ncbi:DUF427 domain-containing protein [Arthrobacter horti]|nr:DUF427 domain-containing protein [Arthrobacter sp. YJM1]